MTDSVLAAPTARIQIAPGEPGRLIVRFPYRPDCAAKIKTVPGRRWHPEGKHWTVPHTDGAVANLLALFAGERVEVDPSLPPASVLNDREPSAEREIPEAVAASAGLPDLVRQAIRARHYSRRTEQAYVAWIARFVGFHGRRHPAEMGEAEVNRFLTHLAVHQRVAASTQN